jgi:hypothetical protein
MSRDISELDELAHEIKVCFDKSENLEIRAQIIAKPAIEALDRGEFVDPSGFVWSASA